MWERSRGDQQSHHLIAMNGLCPYPAAIRGSAGRHIDHEGVTADPARIEPSVDIADGGEGVGRGSGRIEIPVYVVRRAWFRRDLPNGSVAGVEQEHLSPPDFAVNDIPRRIRVEQNQTP